MRVPGPLGSRRQGEGGLGITEPSLPSLSTVSIALPQDTVCFQLRGILPGCAEPAALEQTNRTPAGSLGYPGPDARTIPTQRQLSLITHIMTTPFLREPFYRFPKNSHDCFRGNGLAPAPGCQTLPRKVFPDTNRRTEMIAGDYFAGQRVASHSQAPYSCPHPGLPTRPGRCHAYGLKSPSQALFNSELNPQASTTLGRGGAK